MKRATLISLVLNLLFAGVIAALLISGNSESTEKQNHKPTTDVQSTKLEEMKNTTQITYKLPSPNLEGKVSVEETMAKRRSRRDYVDKALSAEQLSQMLWAAYGITYPNTERDYFRGGFKTAPSAGATYPLEVYAVVGKVKGIEPGVYRYIPQDHSIVMTLDGDLRAKLAQAALNQEMIAEAPVSLFYSAIFERTTRRYGERGEKRYVCMDLGHSAQNVYLQALGLNLGTCAVGAFNDDMVRNVLQIPDEEEPLYIMPVGYYYE